MQSMNEFSNRLINNFDLNYLLITTERCLIDKISPNMDIDEIFSSIKKNYDVTWVVFNKYVHNGRSILKKIHFVMNQKEDNGFTVKYISNYYDGEKAAIYIICKGKQMVVLFLHSSVSKFGSIFRRNLN